MEEPDFQADEELTTLELELIGVPDEGVEDDDEDDDQKVLVDASIKDGDGRLEEDAPVADPPRWATTLPCKYTGL